MASIQAFGLEVVTDLCDQLITAGVPALHFYAMNQSVPSLSVLDSLAQR
jgi:methylenetetrahydrofolate reductase (NADPH)